MTAEEVRQLVVQDVSDAWDTTNAHGVVLRDALVPPRLITVIDRQVHDGKTSDRLIRAWLVLVENPRSQTGYRIVAAEDGSSFGLASEGFPSDEHLVLCGWYGDFLTTFRAM